MAGLSCCSGGLRLCDDPLHSIHDGPNRRERFHFFVGIIRDFDPESILNIEHDDGKVERFNFKFSQGRFERDGLRWVLHVLTQNLNDLGSHLVHFTLSLPLGGSFVSDPWLNHSQCEGKSGIGIDLKTLRVYPRWAPDSLPVHGCHGEENWPFCAFLRHSFSIIGTPLGSQCGYHAVLLYSVRPDPRLPGSRRNDAARKLMKKKD